MPHKANIGLHSIARRLQAKGRGQDSILAHITPEEAEMLEQAGGRGTKNPETGLLEFQRGGTSPATGGVRGAAERSTAEARSRERQQSRAQERTLTGTRAQGQDPRGQAAGRAAAQAAGRTTDFSIGPLEALATVVGTVLFPQFTLPALAGKAGASFLGGRLDKALGLPVASFDLPFDLSLPGSGAVSRPLQRAGGRDRDQPRPTINPPTASLLLAEDDNLGATPSVPETEAARRRRIAASGFGLSAFGGGAPPIIRRPSLLG